MAQPCFAMAKHMAAAEHKVDHTSENIKKIITIKK